MNLTPFSHLKITSHNRRSVKRLSVFASVSNFECVYQAFQSISHLDLLSYLMLKPAAERLLSVVNNRNRKFDVEIRK